MSEDVPKCGVVKPAPWQGLTWEDDEKETPLSPDSEAIAAAIKAVLGD